MYSKAYSIVAEHSTQAVKQFFPPELIKKFLQKRLGEGKFKKTNSGVSPPSSRLSLTTL